MWAFALAGFVDGFDHIIVKLVLTSYWQASRYQREYSWVKPLCQQRLHFLQQVCKVPCKGLHLSSSGRITFSQHVKKVKQNIGWCIQKCNWYLLATRNKIYRSAILPRLKYCAAVWDPHQATDKAALDSVQHFASRVLKKLAIWPQINSLETKLAAPWNPKKADET